VRVLALGAKEGAHVWGEKRGRQREKENLLAFGIKKGVVSQENKSEAMKTYR
jgi:hypothetical protein